MVSEDSSAAAELDPEKQGSAESETAAEQGDEAEDIELKAVSRAEDQFSAILNDQIEILVKNRLAHFDKGPVKAYAARAKNEVTNPYFAMVCERNLTPRIRSAGTMLGFVGTGIAKLIAAGIVYWPPTKEQRYVFVYENNLGKPLCTPKNLNGLGWKQDQVMNAVIKPMINILLDMRDADFVHGCINPFNIFDGGSDKVEKVMLGECLSAPPSFTQPSVYEPVERAMADPIAKGLGTFEDDLYAFGVVLTFMLRHRDPLEGMDDREIIRQKIEQGSYVALTGKERFTGAILELLRGLLYDDRNQRWTLDEVMAWMEGQRLSPKQSSKKLKAARPMSFNDNRYYRPALLAYDLQENPAEAVQLVDGGELEQWIARSLEDNMTRARLEKAMESAQDQGRGPGYSDRLLSRVSVALDPDAPLRYRGLSMHPDGIKYSMTKAFIDKTDIAPYIDITNQMLVGYWLNAQSDAQVDVGNLVTKFDSCRAFLRQNTIGYGIERCLYFLNQDCHCISDKISAYYVTTPEDFMHALEDMSGKPGRPELFIDRHIAAFLSVKDRKVIDAYFIELNAEEFHERIMGNIKVVATIQKRARMEAFPGIAKWISDIMGPVYERYHDRRLRENLKEKVEKLIKTGDLSRIVGLFDNLETKQRDFYNFRKAMGEYEELRDEIDKLQLKLQKPETFGRETGREVAALVSCFIAGFIILVFAFLHFTGNTVF